jgi:hypothetical protein
LLDKNGKQISTSRVDHHVTAVQASGPTVGAKAGKMSGPCLVGEDSITFQQRMMYSIKTETRCIIWRLPAEIGYKGIPETSRQEIQIHCLEKYAYFYDRTSKINENL